MAEVFFQVREVIISYCVRPGCQEWARWEIDEIGGNDGWRVCSRHKRWAQGRVIANATRTAEPRAEGREGE